MNKGKNYNPKIWTEHALAILDAWFPTMPWEMNYFATTYYTCEAWGNDQ